MFSGDLRFATEDFYDISHKGGDRDAYMDGFLLETLRDMIIRVAPAWR